MLIHRTVGQRDTFRMDLNQKLMTAFQIEHVEHLEGIRSMLSRLEQGSGDSDGSELDEAFRCAHSLKGAARIVGLPVVESLAHRLESLFSRIRGSVVALDKETLGVVQLTLDSIEDAAAASFRGETAELPGRIVEEARPTTRRRADSRRRETETARSAGPTAGDSRRIETARRHATGR